MRAIAGPVATSILLVAGCTTDLSLPAAGGVPLKIECADDGDCPGKYVCKQSAGLCFPTSGDTTPPALVGSTVAPDVANAGRKIQASFEVDEPLRIGPVLSINTPTNATFSQVSRTGQSYVFEWVVDPSTPDGSYNIFARLEDVWGNRVENVTVGAVRVDTTPPRLAAAVQVTPSFAGIELLTIDIQVTEELAAEPDVTLVWPQSVTLTERAATLVSTATDRLSYIYSYTVAASDESGSVGIRVEMVDLAENPGTGQEPAVVELDVVPPSPTGVVFLEAPPDSPLDDVTAITHGSRVTVIVVTDEPLSGAPTLTATGPSGAGTTTDLPFDLVDQLGARYTFELLLDDTASGTSYDDGVYALLIQATDIANNLYDDLLTDAAGGLALVIDTAIPAAPDVTTPDAIVYTRIPWGDATGDPRFRVESTVTGVTEGAGTVIAYRLEGTSRVEVGRGPALADGSFAAIQLFPLDVERIYLSFADAASNESPVAEVLDVTLVATLGMSSTPNPGRMRRQPAFGRQFLTRRDSLVDATTVAKSGDALTRVTTPGTEWRRAAIRDAGDPRPSQRTGHGMVRDDVRGRVVLFGGCSDSVTPRTFVPQDDTWVLAGGHWGEVATLDPEFDGDPLPRCGHAMAYDPARDRVVVFGGDNSGTGLADTWEWDGASWTRRDDGNGPSARIGAAMAFDPTSSRILLYGGQTTADFQANGETWAWDGTTWAALSPTDPEGDSNPLPIDHGAMTFDRSADRAVLITPKLWTWTGVSWALTADAPPSFRQDAISGAYHDARGEIVVRSCELSYAFDGSGWSAEGGVTLGQYAGNAMAYDPGLDQLVTFGGMFSVVLPNPPPADCIRAEAQGVDDTHALANDWFRLENNPPPARSYQSAAYYNGDAEQLLVLYDGLLEDGKTWGRKGLRWIDLNDTGPVPRAGHAMVFDRSQKAVVMYGGYTGGTETWHWEERPATQNWRQQCLAGQPCGDTGPTPPDLSDFGIAYDAARAVTVVFGGWGSGQLWEWDASTFIWEQRCDGVPASDTCSPGPGGRADHDMAYDPISGQVMLFGGCSEATQCNATCECNDLWGWDGSDWTLAHGHDAADTSLPLPRVGHRLVFDEGRGVLFLFGGNADYGSGVECAVSTAVCGDTWRWDGSWTELTGPAPSPRAKHTLTYDPNREVSILFGGYEMDGAIFTDLGDTWELNTHTASRPAEIIDFDFGPSGVPAAAICLTSPSSCPYQSVTITWNVGGEGDDGTNVVIGTELLIWENGRWKSTTVTNAMGDAAVGDPTWTDGTATLSWSVTDPQQIGRLLRGNALQLSAAAAAVESAGRLPSGGSVVSDYVQITVRYRN